ncbi:MAG: V-type ATP synthase subunit D [bacterium]|nr:V-type ATP synthase subunit D [bacterium]
MILNVNPTRMELLNLKAKLQMARRGHRLLKDKLDELIRIFMELVEELKKQREITDISLRKSVTSYLITKSSSQPEELEAAYQIPWKTLDIKKSTDYLIGIKVFKFIQTLKDHPKYGSKFQFNFFNISKEFERNLSLETEFLSSIIKMSETELQVNTLGEEIEKTRRRVNALEYIMIPNLMDTIRYIAGKIDETERSTAVRIMKIKDIVRGKSR